MTFQEVKQLHEMGFTPEQITQLNLGSEPQQEPKQEPQQEPKQEPKQEPQQEPKPKEKPDPMPDKKPEPDPVAKKLESMEQKINDFIVAMQRNNIKTASVNILPDDQIDNSANTALSELIRPTIKKEEKQ